MNKVFPDLRKKIKTKQLKIAVVGLGYVGFPLALEFAGKNFRVTGIEIDSDRLKSIKENRSYISDISNNQLKTAKRRGNFSVSADFSSLKTADVVLICVPTPLKRKRLPDISYIKNAVRSVAKHVKSGVLVILESTTYPGTSEEVILPLFEERSLKHGKDFYFCFSPERIDPGNKKFPVHKIPKVVGGISPTATQLATAVYRIIIKQVVPVSSARTAETVKLLENTFRLINIGLIDELAMMAHKMKIDIWEVIQAASTKPFGFMPFYPGPGVGGHCIPKDPLYLLWKARSFGFNSRFIRLASDVISFMPEYVVKRIKELFTLKGIKLSGARILVIGVTYKKDVRDLRKSPSIDIIDTLRKIGARVDYFDPVIPYLRFGKLDLKRAALNQVSRYDCVVIATDHSNIDYAFILKNAKLIFDTRNVFKKAYRKVVKL
ncbi:MAG: nucleotide sugar dehydrogenase [Candidatus Omnitrophota bacterium]|nr:nucleotide sugar dehydrogenase [Candidatus Omnitrophota bacterium]